MQWELLMTCDGNVPRNNRFRISLVIMYIVQGPWFRPAYLCLLMLLPSHVSPSTILIQLQCILATRRNFVCCDAIGRSEYGAAVARHHIASRHIARQCDISETGFSNVHIFFCMQDAMKSPLCDTLYVTDVLAEFEADTFFPLIDKSIYQPIE